MYTRTCNGVPEYYLSHYNIITGCTGFDPAMSHYGRSRDGLLEYFLTGFFSQRGGLPNCGEASNTYVSVFAASCGIWVCCTYDLPDNPTYTCENGWEGPPPHSNGTPKQVTSCKWMSCGTQCCKRTYKVCYDASAGYKKLELVSKIPFGDCSGQAAFSPKPCQTDCQ